MWLSLAWTGRLLGLVVTFVGFCGVRLQWHLRMGGKSKVKWILFYSFLLQFVFTNDFWTCFVFETDAQIVGSSIVPIGKLQCIASFFFLSQNSGLFIGKMNRIENWWLQKMQLIMQICNSYCTNLIHIANCNLFCE